MSLNYTFPFDTCEEPCKDCIAKQPYSTGVNAMSVLILAAFLFTAKTLPFKLVIAGLVAFETMHTYSHFVHVPGNIQQNSIHLIVYYIILTTIFALSQHQPLPTELIIAFIIMFLVDLYIYIKIKKVFMIISGSLLYGIIFTILHYRLHLSKETNNLVIGLLVLILVIIACIINEAVNCHKMLKTYKFPYHVIIETLGMLMFWLMAFVYCTIENEMSTFTH